MNTKHYRIGHYENVMAHYKQRQQFWYKLSMPQAKVVAQKKSEKVHYHLWWLFLC